MLKCFPSPWKGKEIRRTYKLVHVNRAMCKAKLKLCGHHPFQKKKKNKIKFTVVEKNDWLTGKHSGKQNWMLTWNLTTESAVNLKASKGATSDLDLGPSFCIAGNMAASVGQPRLSSNSNESDLLPLFATKFLAKMPKMPGKGSNNRAAIRDPAPCELCPNLHRTPIKTEIGQEVRSELDSF